MPLIDHRSPRYRSAARRWCRIAALANIAGTALLVLGGCGGGRPTSIGDPLDGTVPIALTDMGQRTYKGFTGGLYSAGNEPPAAHAAAGLEQARLVAPLDVAGNPDPDGAYVLLSIGMSNTTQEFCSQSSALPCESWTFMGLAAADPEVNHTTLAIVNGAAGGQAAETWDSPTDANYDRVRDTRLAPLGLSEQQVQIVWVKVARPQPSTALPASNADAHLLDRNIGNILRAIRVRYPNVRQVFLSSRIYAGYATTTLNPEPYAYESGFAVKWVIEAQIRQSAGFGVDGEAGDLDYPGVAPWSAWGAYLWADGTTARSDGLTWVRTDLQADGTHPAPSGQEKVGAMLLAFFRTSPFTRCWFLSAGGSC
ncbi:MAG TPA: hypothetical protein VMM18_16420 [Gemmatimonadaceae bacterium]|nr:hypothetical protein [Gemmatimonadaceae bacterium]